MTRKKKRKVDRRKKHRIARPQGPYGEMIKLIPRKKLKKTFQKEIIAERRRRQLHKNVGPNVNYNQTHPQSHKHKSSASSTEYLYTARPLTTDEYIQLHEKDDEDTDEGEDDWDKIKAENSYLYLIPGAIKCYRPKRPPIEVMRLNDNACHTSDLNDNSEEHLNSVSGSESSSTMEINLPVSQTSSSSLFTPVSPPINPPLFFHYEMTENKCQLSMAQLQPIQDSLSEAQDVNVPHPLDITGNSGDSFNQLSKVGKALRNNETDGSKKDYVGKGKLSKNERLGLTRVKVSKNTTPILTTPIDPKIVSDKTSFPLDYILKVRQHRKMDFRSFEPQKAIPIDKNSDISTTIDQDDDASKETNHCVDIPTNNDIPTGNGVPVISNDSKNESFESQKTTPTDKDSDTPTISQDSDMHNDNSPCVDIPTNNDIPTEPQKTTPTHKDSDMPPNSQDSDMHNDNSPCVDIPTKNDIPTEPHKTTPTEKGSDMPTIGQDSGMHSSCVDIPTNSDILIGNSVPVISNNSKNESFEPQKTTPADNDSDTPTICQDSDSPNDKSHCVDTPTNDDIPIGNNVPVISDDSKKDYVGKGKLSKNERLGMARVKVPRNATPTLATPINPKIISDKISLPLDYILKVKQHRKMDFKCQKTIIIDSDSDASISKEQCKDTPTDTPTDNSQHKNTSRGNNCEDMPTVKTTPTKTTTNYVYNNFDLHIEKVSTSSVCTKPPYYTTRQVIRKPKVKKRKITSIATPTNNLSLWQGNDVSKELILSNFSMPTKIATVIETYWNEQKPPG